MYTEKRFGTLRTGDLFKAVVGGSMRRLSKVNSMEAVDRNGEVYRLRPWDEIESVVEPSSKVRRRKKGA